jgi:methylmalonyl-CoA mutase cobalamin-binding subunit
MNLHAPQRAAVPATRILKLDRQASSSSHQATHFPTGEGAVREHVYAILQRWAQSGRPTRETYLEGARELEARRRRFEWGGLWPQSPQMVTATVDDGWGRGLEVIEALAAALGVAVHPLGVLQSPATIVSACRHLEPDLLGLTVLQFDSDTSVQQIAAALPPVTTMIAGGAAYRYDPEFAERTGTHAVACDGVAFVKFLLNFQPLARRGKDRVS